MLLPHPKSPPQMQRYDKKRKGTTVMAKFNAIHSVPAGSIRSEKSAKKSKNKAKTLIRNQLITSDI